MWSQRKCKCKAKAKGKCLATKINRQSSRTTWKDRNDQTIGKQNAIVDDGVVNWVLRSMFEELRDHGMIKVGGRFDWPWWMQSRVKSWFERYGMMIRTYQAIQYELWKMDRNYQVLSVSFLVLRSVYMYWRSNIPHFWAWPWTKKAKSISSFEFEDNDGWIQVQVRLQARVQAMEANYAVSSKPWSQVNEVRFHWWYSRIPSWGRYWSLFCDVEVMKKVQFHLMHWVKPPSLKKREACKPSKPMVMSEASVREEEAKSLRIKAVIAERV
jgi:hypothetical protein